MVESRNEVDSFGNSSHPKNKNLAYSVANFTRASLDIRYRVADEYAKISNRETDIAKTTCANVVACRLETIGHEDDSGQLSGVLVQCPAGEFYCDENAKKVATKIKETVLNLTVRINEVLDQLL